MLNGQLCLEVYIALPNVFWKGKHKCRHITRYGDQLEESLEFCSKILPEHVSKEARMLVQYLDDLCIPRNYKKTAWLPLLWKD